jgi:hypothetical protein
MTILAHTETDMATDQAVRLSPSEYLAFERGLLSKHEYVDGELREKTGASRPHVLIAGNIHVLLANSLRGTHSAARIRLRAAGF